jgi:hypothetical protein
MILSPPAGAGLDPGNVVLALSGFDLATMCPT